jgi:FMN reductase
MLDVKKIAVITAGLSQPSSTRLLADRLAEATVNDLRERDRRRSERRGVA